jgi:hypothetical protein
MGGGINRTTLEIPLPDDIGEFDNDTAYEYVKKYVYHDDQEAEFRVSVERILNREEEIERLKNLKPGTTASEWFNKR